MDNSTAAVADPRAYHRGVMGVQRWDEPSCTVTGGAAPTRGAFSVADPREAAARYTLADVDQLMGACDPRRPPAEIPIIMAADGTWHRPLTTLELAALQGFPVRVGGEWLVLSGTSTTAWRERIGNAIPVGAARAIGEQKLRALLAGDMGQLFELSADPVWVAPHLHGAVAA
jgi:site-specific DNA-cytosine methylase